MDNVHLGKFSFQIPPESCSSCYQSCSSCQNSLIAIRHSIWIFFFTFLPHSRFPLSLGLLFVIPPPPPLGRFVICHLSFVFCHLSSPLPTPYASAITRRFTSPLYAPVNTIPNARCVTNT